VVQQGGLKLCCTIATSDPSTDPEVKKAARLEAAHAVAKTLVTINPHLLTEHQRLGVRTCTICTPGLPVLRGY
jgi:hypothetical protein